MSNTVNLETSFTFRTNKEGYKRPNVDLAFDVPSADGIIDAITNGDDKTRELVIETIQGLIVSHVRSLVDADTDFDQAKLDELINADKITLSAIANLPRSERNILSKEDLEAFAQDYIKYQPAIAGKSEAQVKTAATLFLTKFKQVAGENSVLAILQQQLNLFIENADAEVVATHEKALSFLSNKLEELLNVKITAESL